MGEEEEAGKLLTRNEGVRMGQRWQEINYPQSAALLLQVSCPFAFFKAFRGDARPTGGACGEKGVRGRAVGERVEGKGGGERGALPGAHSPTSNPSPPGRTASPGWGGWVCDLQAPLPALNSVTET